MVQITIDTQRDSPQEIRESIRYLQTLIGDEVLSESSYEESVPETSAGAFSMFGDTSQPTPDTDLASNFNASEVFGSDDEAPSDVDDEEAIIEIVEY